MFGHSGRILKVNLSTGEIRQEDYGEEFARTFLGGNGFAAKLIYDGVGADVDPLDDRSAIVFTVGPLTDTPIWGTSRGHLAGISPQTGLFVDSNFGGRFSTAQKRSGFDAIYITGASSRPVYLLVSEDGGQIKDAAGLWGKNTQETNDALQTAEGKGATAASIGPAGENLVVFANIVCGGGRTGAAGRGGLGAVMGSKKLKAVVATGGRKTQIARLGPLKAYLNEHAETLKSNTAPLTTYGTPMLVTMINARGLLCTHNAARETFDFAGDIGGDVLKEKYIVRNTACPGCPVACGKNVKVSRGEYAGRSLKMPEYETIYAMGSMLDNRDIVSIINGNGVCDLYGLDTISMGVTLSFVAECLEKGIVSPGEIGGEVNFADGPGMVELIKATATRRGVGDLLALGSEALASRFGPEAGKYLYSVKGLEIAGHSARGLRPMALGYATATRGGSHHDTRPKYLMPDTDGGFAGQPEYSIRSQHCSAVGDSLIMCRFIQERGLGWSGNQDAAEVLSFVTGWTIDGDELERIGERIYNMERLINVQRGVSRRRDTLPQRTMNEPIPEGPASGRCCSRTDLEAMLDEYYRLRGWTQEGIPSEEKLSELGLK
ncbi:MAG: aldehyde ferredoxin oxidoreductase family protein [Phycisphaerae bacterium]|jgi:aldehyde:ferredoxin oxidoreductase|nr:aldehyde ferredoxin oxidoreductase family protein [Phycisphaerae bacterium]